MAHQTTLFPCPPPTHNTLTMAERSHLLRSNAKIGQLLGSTPHVVDVDEVRSSQAPVDKKARRRSLPASLYTTSSDSPSPSPCPSLSGSTLDVTTSRSSCDTEFSGSVASSATSVSSHRSSSSKAESQRSWRIPFTTSCKPPILRLGRSTSSSASRSRATGANTVVLPLTEHKPDAETHEQYSPTSPTFAIASESSVRRQKMTRLRKRLGDGVPVHLVFPPNVEPESDDEELAVVKSPTNPVSAATPPPKPTPAPIPTPTPRTKRAERRETIIFKPNPRRSQFASSDDASRPGKVVTVHYTEPGNHGASAETFKGMTFSCRKITTIPEE